MARPTSGPDDWWLAVLWVVDDDGVVSFADVAPSAGAPKEPPLLHLGPSLVGSLSGLILEEDGRSAVQLAPMVPPDDPAQPWRSPLALRAALRWQPVRAAAMQPTELAEAVLVGFRRSVAALARP
jgi:hypothetical protein